VELRSVSIEAHIREKALALGFDAVGFARADVPLDVEHARYQAFIAEGKHGEMRYLAENAEVRRTLTGEDILPGARSVVCVALRYQRDTSNDPPLMRGVALYARGQDYHGFMRKKLRRLAAFLRTLGGDARPMVDDVPVLERAWAARAGLGFIGKNGMLIIPGIGSMVLLGEVVTTLELEPGSTMSDRCGSCTRCLDACPTSAFERPFVLDAQKCISYLTIEKRGGIEVTLREKIGEHLFGCDDCQTVCPFNKGQNKELSKASGFIPLERWRTMELEALLFIEEDALEGTPLKRAQADGLARNAAIVLGNRRAGKGALEEAARTHRSETVRDAAEWALSRFGAS
jgi:epoxyqueuosine reductase